MALKHGLLEEQMKENWKQQIWFPRCVAVCALWKERRNKVTTRNEEAGQANTETEEKLVSQQKKDVTWQRTRTQQWAEQQWRRFFGVRSEAATTVGAAVFFFVGCYQAI
jgi:hypothetical protein